MNTTKNLALRKPLLISAWLLAMQGATYAQNPIVQTQLTTDPAPRLLETVSMYIPVMMKIRLTSSG